MVLVIGLIFIIMFLAGIWWNGEFLKLALVVAIVGMGLVIAISITFNKISETSIYLLIPDEQGDYFSIEEGLVIMQTNKETIKAPLESTYFDYELYYKPSIEVTNLHCKAPTNRWLFCLYKSTTHYKLLLS